jgi:hypothetical protein
MGVFLASMKCFLEDLGIISAIQEQIATKGYYLKYSLKVLEISE